MTASSGDTADRDSSPHPEEVGLGSGLSARSPGPAERPDRRSGAESLTAGTYALLAAGVVLLAAALLAAETASTAGVTALSGALAIALAAALLTEILAPRLVAAVGLIGGLALGISALTPEAIRGPEVGRLIAGAMLLLGSAGILAATVARRDHGEPS